MTANGDTDPWPHTEMLVESFGGREGEAALGADQVPHPLEVDRPILLDRDQEIAFLIVAQEQILGVGAWRSPL